LIFLINNEEYITCGSPFTKREVCTYIIFKYVLAFKYLRTFSIQFEIENIYKLSTWVGNLTNIKYELLHNKLEWFIIKNKCVPNNACIKN